MKQNSPCATGSSEPEPTGEDTLEPSRRRLVRRRSLLHVVGAAATTVSATAFLAAASPESERDDRPLTRGDAAILRLAASIELIEADLWQQYNELGGAVDQNDNPNPGNPAYLAAL